MQSVRNRQHSQCVVNVGMCDHPAAVTAQHTGPNAQVVVELFVVSGVVALGPPSRVHHIIMDCIIRRLYFITASVTIALITYTFTVIKAESNKTLSWVREKSNTTSFATKMQKRHSKQNGHTLRHRYPRIGQHRNWQRRSCG